MSGPPGFTYELSDARSALDPPGGKPLIAHVVVNIETWPYDQPMPRGILPAPHGAAPVPDVPNFGWVEYGLRCGLPRIVSLLSERGVPASASMNAAVISAYPPIAEAVVAAGWELIAHGLVQRSLTLEEDESGVIAETISTIARFAGSPPRGWLGPGLQQTLATAGLLVQHGLDYVCDWILDDLPTWTTTTEGPLLAVPYSLELNDSVLHAVECHGSDALLRRLEATLETYEVETSGGGVRIVTLGIHPHLMGVPHRWPTFVRCIDLLRKRTDLVFMTGSQIADWYRSQVPPPRSRPAPPASS